MTFKHFTYTLFISLLFAQCKKEPEVDQGNLVDDFDRKAMLENLSNNFILPGYQAYVNQILSLEESITEFENNPTSTNFNTLTTDYIIGTDTWQAISFLEFGPAANIALRSQSNIYPIDTALVNQNIVSGGYNLGIASNYNAKGWQSLDYLIFVHSDTATAIDYFINNPDAVLYMKNVVTDLKTNAQYVNNSWQSYKTEFVNNNSNNANGSAVSDMTNAIIAHYEAYIRKGKIGLPAGVFNGFSQTPMPGHVENRFQNIQLESASTAMTYFKRFMNGNNYDGSTDGAGLLDYANFAGAMSDGEKLSTVINSQIDKVLLANEYNTMPWADLVQQNAPLSNDIYLEYQKIVPLIKVDLTSALGIIITYQDNDGD